MESCHSLVWLQDVAKEDIKKLEVLCVLVWRVSLDFDLLAGLSMPLDHKTLDTSGLTLFEEVSGDFC